MQTLTLEYLGEIIEKVSGLFLSKAYKKYIISPSGLMNAYLSENENHEIPQVFYRVQTIYCPKLMH
jgi:CubicO group peptidase (beta-lactamase class C family)